MANQLAAVSEGCSISRFYYFLGADTLSQRLIINQQGESHRFR